MVGTNNLIYQSNDNYRGEDNLTVTANDGDKTTTKRVLITVNDNPTLSIPEFVTTSSGVKITKPEAINLIFSWLKAKQKVFAYEAAAKISAPPGYSEHHTGFAIDLTDGNFPKKDLTIDFENTNAYKWLTRHAQDFGFELSFPPNNLQGLSYEPWHWRYIGSPEAASAFAQARKF